MIRTTKWTVGLAAATAGALTLVALPANATAILTISDSNVGSCTLASTDSTGAYCGGNFFLLNNTSTGSMNVLIIDGNGTRGISDAGSSYPPSLHLHGGFEGPGTLNLSLTDSFTGLGNIEFLTSVGGDLGGTHDTATFSSSSSFGPLASFAFTDPPLTGLAFSGSKVNGQTLTASPYDLTLNGQIVNDNTNPFLTTSFDLSINAVPEPATFALFGAGLLGFALFLRRRRVPSA